MNIMKNKILKDILMGYIYCFVSFSMVIALLPFISTDIEKSTYEVFITSMPGVFMIAAIVMGCLSIQYIRIFMLSGATRKKAFTNVLSINLVSVIPSIVLYSIVLLLPSNEMGFIFPFLYFIAGIVIGLGFGLYASSITTIGNVFFSIVAIGISSLLVFILPFTLSTSLNFDLKVPMFTSSIFGLCLMPTSYFIYTRKRSRIKSTAIN